MDGCETRLGWTASQVVTFLAQGFSHAWFLNMVGTQRDHVDSLLGSTESPLPTKHHLAQITESLLQART